MSEKSTASESRRSGQRVAIESSDTRQRGSQGTSRTWERHPYPYKNKNCFSSSCRICRVVVGRTRVADAPHPNSELYHASLVKPNTCMNLESVALLETLPFPAISLPAGGRTAPFGPALISLARKYVAGPLANLIRLGTEAYRW